MYPTVMGQLFVFLHWPRMGGHSKLDNRKPFCNGHKHPVSENRSTVRKPCCRNAVSAPLTPSGGPSTVALGH